MPPKKGGLLFLIPGSEIIVQQPIPLTREWVVKLLAWILMEHALCMCEGNWLQTYSDLQTSWSAQLGLDGSSFFWDSYDLAVDGIESMPLKPKVCSKILEGFMWQMRIVSLTFSHDPTVVWPGYAQFPSAHSQLQFAMYSREIVAWKNSLSRAEWQQTLSED